MDASDNFYMPVTSISSATSANNASSLLQKRNYETFSDADFDDCVQVEEENIEEDEEEMIGASSSSSSPPPCGNIKEDFQLVDSFSSYAQAFSWCTRNGYKYRHHSKISADELLENKKYKWYIYGCNCHGANCPNERKLEFRSTGQGTYDIGMSERGQHCSASIVPRRRGIDLRLLDFIDYLCKEDKPPKEIRYSIIRKAHAGEWGPIKDLIIPSVEQIKCRKKTVKKEGEKYQQYNRAYRLQEWVDANLLDSEEQFKSLPDDKVFTLGHLNYKYINSRNETVDCVAFAYSTKDLLRNALRQAESSPGPAYCGGNADATFNLLKDNWVLHAFGCRGLKKSSEGATDFDFQLTHQFRPFAFALAPTENQVVYEFLFRVTSEALFKFFQFVLLFSAFCQDRSPSIANAVHTRWPECKVVLCWPHIVRGAIDRGKLVDKTLFDLFTTHLTYVHSARSQLQFEKILLPLMLLHWREIGEHRMADVFEKVYGTEPWTNWHVSSSGIPGLTPNNNAIESWNRVIKRIFPPGVSSIGKHLLEDMPTMMQQITNELGATNGGPILSLIPGSPNRHVLDKAMKLVESDVDLKAQDQPTVRNYFVVKKGTKMHIKDFTFDFDGYIFNSSSTTFQDDMNNAMTARKARIYSLSVQGISKTSWTFEEACQTSLTAHAVQVQEATHDTIQPIAFPGLPPLKYHYRCDCKGWWHSLVCAHVLAAMHLENDINLNVVNAKINKPALPGRPASYQPVGYKAQQPTSGGRLMSNRQATNLKGMYVAFRVNGIVYTGIITTHREKLNEQNEACIIWTALFDEKLNPEGDGESDNTILPFYEDFTFDSMKQANALHKTQCKLRKQNGKIALE